jgi:hypothetical protein
MGFFRDHPAQTVIGVGISITVPQTAVCEKVSHAQAQARAQAVLLARRRLSAPETRARGGRRRDPSDGSCDPP